MRRTIDSRLRRMALLLCLVAALPAFAASSTISSVLQRTPILNPNLSAFPDSSLLDRSDLLDAPAGKHGFVTVKDGHFVFADGQRARFFGINLAKDTVFIDKPQIDRLAALFARAGVNLVRIHHIDDAQGILDPSSKRFFREDKLNTVDYWVAKLKERGIYVCLDLNDYRTFRADEGVPNGEQLGRGAKPYAVFDERIIARQQEYAKEFLVNHVNPYTKLAYARDPAVAILEIYDENGLFIRRGDWPNLYGEYKVIFEQQWNAWLHYRYGNTEALRKAWTDRTGFCALSAEENLEKATVRLPRMDLQGDVPQTNNPLLAPARVSDGVQFAYEMQQGYLRLMRDSLREMGVKIPITAVGAQDILPDLMATAGETDYIGINYYWDHPSWNPGKDWTMPAYFSLKNPIADNPEYSFPATVSLAHMYGKPLVVRELGYCFPNAYRGAGMVEAAAYGAFLDLDALILFTYDANQNARAIGYFDIHLDPLRWGLVSQASRLFLSGEVQAAKNTVGIGYTDVDAFSWYQYLSPLYQLAFATRVVNYTDTATTNPLDLLITSGRASGRPWQGERLLVFANQRHADLHFQEQVDAVENGYGYTVTTGRGGAFDFAFGGFGYDNGSVRRLQAWPAFSVEDLKARKLQPLGVADTAAQGFIDPARKVIAFHNLKPELAARFAVDALRDWRGAPISHSDQDKNCWRTDTLQLERDVNARVLRVNAPKIQALVGRLDTPAALRTGALALTTSTPLGTLTAESLDGKPLADSASYLVKMTSRAVNDQVQCAAANDGPKQFKLSSLGNAPIMTDGKPVDTPTHVELAGKPLIDLYLQNGTWEYLTEPGRSLLYLDTANIMVKLPKQPKLVRWYTPGDVMDLVPTSPTFTIPNGVLYTEIIWE